MKKQYLITIILISIFSFVSIFGCGGDDDIATPSSINDSQSYGSIILKITCPDIKGGGDADFIFSTGTKEKSLTASIPINTKEVIVTALDGDYPDSIFVQKTVELIPGGTVITVLDPIPAGSVILKAEAVRTDGRTVSIVETTLVVEPGNNSAALDLGDYSITLEKEGGNDVIFTEDEINLKATLEILFPSETFSDNTPVPVLMPESEITFTIIDNGVGIQQKAVFIDDSGNEQDEWSACTEIQSQNIPYIGSCNALLKAKKSGNITVKATYAAILNNGEPVFVYEDSYNLYIEDSWGPDERLDYWAGTYFACNPHIAATDSLGEAYACWDDNRDWANDEKAYSFYSKRNFLGSDSWEWEGNYEIAASDGDPAWQVDMVIPSNQNPHFVWNDRRDDEWTEKTRSIPSFSKSSIYIKDTGDWVDRSVSHTPNNHFSYDPAIAILKTASGDEVYAVWRDTRVGTEYDTKFYYKNKNEGNNPTPLDIHFTSSGSPLMDYYPNIADYDNHFTKGKPCVAGNSQAIYLAWLEEDNSIASARFRDGFWVYIGQVTEYSDSPPDIATAPGSGIDKVFIVWSSGGHIYISSNQNNGVWESPVRVTDDNSAGAHSPSVAVDGLGKPHVIWVDERNASQDIYYSYCYSWPDNWIPNIQVNDTYESKTIGKAIAATPIPVVSRKSYTPEIAISPWGKAYAVWADDREDGTHIYFSERNLSTE